MPDYGWAYINLDVLKTIEGPDITGSIAIVKNSTTFSGSKYLAYATASNKLGIGLNFPTVLPAYQLDVSASAGQTTAAKFDGDIRVSGSAFVSGTLRVETLQADTVISSSNLIVRDPIIGLGFGDGAGQTGSAGDRGFIFGLPTNANQAIVWDQTSGSFVVGKVGAAGPDRSAFDVPTADLSALKVGAITGSRGGYFADRVGVGTATPEGKVHVLAASAGSVTVTGEQTKGIIVENDDVASITLLDTAGGVIYFGDAADTDIGRIGYRHGGDYANSLYFTTNNSQRMTIDSAGQVGIGTPTPAGTLHVSSSAAGTKGLVISAKGNQSADLFTIQDKTGASSIKVDASGELTLSAVSASSTLKVAGALSASDNTLYADPTTSRVGINAALPAAEFHVKSPGGNDSLYVDDQRVTIGSTDAQAGLYVNTENDNMLQVRYNKSGGTELFYISGSGATGVGTTSPSGYLHISGSDGGQKGLVVSAKGNQSVDLLTVQNKSGATSAKMDADGVTTLTNLTASILNLASPATGSKAGPGSYLALNTNKDLVLTTAGGAVSAVANGANDRIATFSSADALNGEASLTFDGSVLTVADDISVAAKVIHTGDTDTHIKFDTDKIEFTAGGGELLILKEDTQNIVTVGKSSSDTDFQVMTAGNDNTLFVQGSADSVGIGTSSPSGLLHVSSSANNVKSLVINAIGDQSVDVVTVTQKTGATCFKISETGTTTITDLAQTGGSINNATIGASTAAPVTMTAGAVKYRSKANSDSPYSVVASDYIIGVNTSGGAVEIDLQAASSAGAGRMLIIKDVGGAAGTNNITIDPNGSEKIDGQSTVVIAANSGSVMLFCDGSNYFIAGTR